MSENGGFISLETVYLSFLERRNFVIRKYIKLKFASSNKFDGTEALQGSFIMHFIISVILWDTQNDWQKMFASGMLLKQIR